MHVWLRACVGERRLTYEVVSGRVRSRVFKYLRRIISIYTGRREVRWDVGLIVIGLAGGVGGDALFDYRRVHTS